MFRFIHAADLHLDAPFKGLSGYEGAPVERMQNSTRQAFENLVQLALDEQVDFVVIAGDLFDGRWTNIQTGLWTANQFRRLESRNIPVFLIRGNHDALSEVPRRISWPANVREFSVEHPETMQLEQLAVALHGQGFTSREVREDVAAKYPEPVAGMFNIGLLHTSLSGDSRHDTYAPTSEKVLVDKGYDYWALGHIHLRGEIRETPRIAYSGCTQGRHIHEQGAKGCLLIEVDGPRLTSTFKPLDLLRWQRLAVELGECEHLDEVYDTVSDRLREARDDAEGRFLAVRIELEGMTPCHHEFMRTGGAELVLNELRNRSNQLGDVWIEQVKFDTLPPVDVEKLKQADDLLGELLRDFEQLQGTESESELASLAEALAPLMSKTGAELREAELDLQDPDNIQRWLTQAEALLLTQLAQDEQSGA